MAQLELNKGNSKEYNVKLICDSKIYTKELDSSHYLPSLYYLILWKDHPEKKNTWELALAVEYLWRLITTFDKKHFEKPIATFSPINLIPLMARAIIKFKVKASIKQKRDQLAKANGTNKRAKMS